MSILHRIGVYTLRNLVNEWEYIGSTSQSFAIRWSVHLGALRKGEHVNTALQSDWDRHGEGAFVFLISECTETGIDARERERAWIALRSQEIGGKLYNVGVSEIWIAPSDTITYSPADLDFLMAQDSVVLRVGAQSAKSIDEMRRESLAYQMAEQGASTREIQLAARLSTQRACRIQKEVRDRKMEALLGGSAENSGK